MQYYLEGNKRPAPVNKAGLDIAETATFLAEGDTFMFLNKPKEIGFGESDTLTKAKFLEQILGNPQAGFERESMVRTQLFGRGDLIQMLPAALHQFFKAITFYAEPAINSRLLARSQVFVVDCLAEGTYPLLESGQTDPPQEHADHRPAKSAAQKVAFPRVARNNAFPKHDDRCLDVIEDDPRPYRVADQLFDELVGRIVLVDLVSPSPNPTYPIL